MRLKHDDGVRYLTRSIFPLSGKDRKERPYGRQGDRVTIISSETTVCIVEMERSLNRFPCCPGDLSVDPVPREDQAVKEKPPVKKSTWKR